jgi:enamine deaminase RidA (YjgF/YER057c/UK114 family)
MKERCVSANIRFLNPASMSTPRNYSQVVEMTGPGRTVWIAGQLGLDRTGNLVGAGDFSAQAVQVFENLKAALAEVGADFSHVAKLNNYLADIAHLPLLRQVRDRYLDPAALPASTSVQVAAFARPDALLEIEAVAVLSAK